MDYYSPFSCRYNETDVVIFLKQEAMLVSEFYGFQSKEKKIKNRATKLNRDKFPYSALRGKQLGWRFGRVPVCGRKNGRSSSER